jgi:hypothetical protein
MIILADKQEEMKAVDEERQAWLQKVLVALGANPDIIKKNTIEAKNHISSLGLDVVLKPEGEINILRFDYEEINGETVEKGCYPVAQWLSPKYILKIEDGKKFYEIHIEEWALPFQMLNLGE